MKNAKLVAILLLTVMLAAVVLQNRAPVQTRFLFVTIEMPQILLLLITSCGGFCLGLLVALAAKAKPKKEAEPS